MISAIRRHPGLWLVCAAAAAAPLLLDRAPPPADLGSFPGWPETFEGLPLVPDPLDRREREYAEAFPGRMARFRQGDRVVVVHWVVERSRLFHFSRRCLRGRGWTLEPAPIEVDELGRRWGAWHARRDGRSVTLRQRIEDAGGAAWTDRSSWYWAALRGKTRGPWWAWTVAEDG